jgi:hypothetical protein
METGRRKRAQDDTARKEDDCLLHTQSVMKTLRLKVETTERVGQWPPAVCYTNMFICDNVMSIGRPTPQHGNRTDQSGAELGRE